MAVILLRIKNAHNVWLVCTVVYFLAMHADFLTLCIIDKREAAFITFSREEVGADVFIK